MDLDQHVRRHTHYYTIYTNILPCSHTIILALKSMTISFYQPKVGTSEGSFSDKIFQLTNELIPSVQRSRINFHRGDASQESIRELKEKRNVLFSEWG